MMRHLIVTLMSIGAPAAPAASQYARLLYTLSFSGTSDAGWSGCCHRPNRHRAASKRPAAFAAPCRTSVFWPLPGAGSGSMLGGAASKIVRLAGHSAAVPGTGASAVGASATNTSCALARRASGAARVARISRSRLGRPPQERHRPRLNPRLSKRTWTD